MSLEGYKRDFLLKEERLKKSKEYQNIEKSTIAPHCTKTINKSTKAFLLIGFKKQVDKAKSDNKRLLSIDLVHFLM
jgi:hypothetical protein